MARTQVKVALLAGALIGTAALTGCTATATATGSGTAAAAKDSPAPRTAATAPRATTSRTAVNAKSAPDAAAAKGSAATAAARGSASAALTALPVKGRAPKTGYSRAQFGAAWADVDRNGCDTRNDVLRRDLTAVRFTPGTNGCQVAAGTLPDPYSGTIIAFTRGASTSTAVQIDHVVALSNAWQTGALTWMADTREALANDPLELLAVQGRLNEQKSDGDAATWLPPNRAVRCTYVARQVAVKVKYGLWVTPPEEAAIAHVLATCPGQPLPAGGPAPHTASAPLASPTPTARAHESTARPVAPTGPEAAGADPTGAVSYASCGAVRAAGKAPLSKGQPGYRAGLDRDHDGIACE